MSSKRTESGSSAKSFDLERVYILFKDALQDKSQTVDLECYCNAWHELNKFLDTLGTLFHFVTHDVKSKLAIIEEYIKTSREHYQSVNSTLKYEVENDLTKTKKPSGSRTLLRLHRALNYLIVFFEKLVNAKLDAKCSSLSSDAYSHTLGKYHPWIVRKAATLAMYSLPTKVVLLERIDSEPGSEERVMETLRNIISTGKPIYDLTEELYASYKLLDLP